jgi:hypothetical protein
MKIDRSVFDSAVENIDLDEEKAERLWQELAKRTSGGFNFSTVAYYFGALIIIAAMTVFLTIAWEAVGGMGLFMVAFAYLIILGGVGLYLWFVRHLKTAGGLLVVVAVCMTPVAVYGLELATGFLTQNNVADYDNFYTWLRSSGVLMELSTLLVSGLALGFVRFPFIAFPLSVAAYMFMREVSFFLSKSDWSYSVESWVNIIVGGVMVLVAYLIDQRSEEDFALWPYIVGLSVFWFGLIGLNDGRHMDMFVFFLVSLLLVLLSIFLERRVFIVYGALGVAGYLGFLAFDVFADSLLFPIVLSLIGLLVIAGGIVYQRKSSQLSEFFDRRLPEQVRRLRPKHRQP